MVRALPSSSSSWSSVVECNVVVKPYSQGVSVVVACLCVHLYLVLLVASLHALNGPQRLWIAAMIVFVL